MVNPWLDRRVLHFAHRGGGREAPPNTLLAMRQALASGADALELDVHATADGELVVCHDATVDATTNATGAIADMTLTELEALDNAYWWVDGLGESRDGTPGDYPYRGRAPEQVDLRLPTLRAVLEAFPGVLLNIDIKQTAPAVAPYEATLAALLAEFGRSDDVIVGSFFDQAVAAFARLAPDVGTAAGPATLARCWQALLAGDDLPVYGHVALQVPVSFAGVRVVDQRFLTAAHAAGVAVHVWTIDEPDEMLELIDLGVDGIMTDRPTVLREVLDSRGAGWPGPPAPGAGGGPPAAQRPRLGFLP